MIESIVTYFSQNSSDFFQLAVQHIFISLSALAMALAIGFPLGVISARSRRASAIIAGTLSGLRVVPSIALLFLIVVLTGRVGVGVSIFALTVLALPVILINTTVAFNQIPAPQIEAAQALGLKSSQTFWSIKLPLALPVILAGMKTASSEVIASATLATYVGGGGLGNLIFTGLGLMRTDLLLIGGAAVATLSLSALAVIGLLERILTPWKHLRT